MNRYKELIARGLCGKCKTPNTNEKALCDLCAEKARVRAAAKRERNAAKGVCINCGKPIGTRSTTKCDGCLDIARASADKTRVKRKAAGVCQSCGKRPPIQDKTICHECSAQMTATRLKHYEQFKKEGRCINCGDEPEGDYSQCKKCRQRDRDRNQTLRMETLDAYGGRKCAGCGSTYAEVLELDHVYGGGCEHRRDIGSGSSLYQYLKRNGYPEEIDGHRFRVLCPTCNRAAAKGEKLPNET